jgi:hypothetical protein
MNRTLIVAALSLTFPLAGMTQSPTETASLSTPMTAHEVHNLMTSAHSSAEYKQIAGYFHHQEEVYRAHAADAKTRWDQLAKVNAGRYQKYPRPVDTAQSSYESYMSSADNAALKARHYDQLAADQNLDDRQLAASSQNKQ